MSGFLGVVSLSACGLSSEVVTPEVVVPKSVEIGELFAVRVLQDARGTLLGRLRFDREHFEAVDTCGITQAIDWSNCDCGAERPSLDTPCAGERYFRAIAPGPSEFELSVTRNVVISAAVNVYSSNPKTGEIVHQGVVGSDEVWEAGPRHVVQGELVVENGATLTILAGATVAFENGSALIVARNSPGWLMIYGTRDSPADLAPRNESWRGIRIFAHRSMGSRITNAIIRGTTGMGEKRAALELFGDACCLSGKELIEISYTVIQECVTGIALSGMHSTTIVRSVGNVIENCTTPVWCDPSSLGAIPLGDFFANERAEVAVEGGSAGKNHHEWRNHGVPYVIAGNIVIEPDSVPAVPYVETRTGINVTVERGTALVFERNVGLYVGSFQQSATSLPVVNFSAMGTLTQPIRFTGAASVPGYWTGIVFMENTETSIGTIVTRLHNSIVEFGGAPRLTIDGALRKAGVTFYPGLKLINDRESLWVLDGSLVRWNAGFGVMANSPTVTMERLLDPFRPYALSTCVCENELGEVAADWSTTITNENRQHCCPAPAYWVEP